MGSPLENRGLIRDNPVGNPRDKPESWNNLIELYEAWGKPEKADEWRKKLPCEQAIKE